MFTKVIFPKSPRHTCSCCPKNTKTLFLYSLFSLNTPASHMSYFQSQRRDMKIFLLYALFPSSLPPVHMSHFRCHSPHFRPCNPTRMVPARSDMKIFLLYVLSPLSRLGASQENYKKEEPTYQMATDHTQNLPQIKKKSPTTICKRSKK